MQQVPRLLTAAVHQFRRQAVEVARPAYLPKAHFACTGSGALPALAKWFKKDSIRNELVLDDQYISKYGSELVPVEMTRFNYGDGAIDEFARAEMPLSDFVALITAKIPPGSKHQTKPSPSVNFYLAQCPISSLNRVLQEDLPTPELVLQAGKGDVYDSSIWIGPAPTYTSLHKDPNPNLFVQLAGQKIVRLFEPGIGLAIFQEAKRQLGTNGSAAVRGEEMMRGPERRMLQDLVWEQADQRVPDIGYEAVLGPGDALYIPKGWWHSIRGTGNGINGSANWWFR